MPKEAKEQTYANHVRWYPLFHFVVVPLLLIVLIFNVVLLYQEPSWNQVIRLLFAIAVILLALVSRLQSLKVQDRVIRLEEQLRHARILPDELSSRAASAITPSQLIALRFAADEELADLVERTLNGEFEKPKAIKLAVKNWRADWMRA
jgi:hypothetical protein